ncbi:hypothetical protein [Clostridium perfringens]|uniref:hypothetical protein n=2 Tax=Clostridium perfringens TaxID=1502 RepID=UPI003D328A49
MINKINELLNNVKIKENELKEAKKELEEFVPNNIDELSKCDLKQLVGAYNNLKYMLDNDVCNKLNDIIDVKEKELFPELTKAYYYPELNKLKDKMNLSFDVIRKIDEGLKDKDISLGVKKAKIGEVDLLTLSEDVNVSEKIFNFLVEENIVERYFSFKICNCFECRSKILKEEEYKKYIEMFEILDKINNNKASDEEINMYYEEEAKDLPNYTYFSVSCLSEYRDDDLFEVMCMEDLNKLLEKYPKKTFYNIKKTPDLSLNDKIFKYLNL